MFPKIKPLVIGNWKMRLSTKESVELAKEIKNHETAKIKAEIVICPTFTAISEVVKAVKSNYIKVGAQNCFWEGQGSYTGEVSAHQLSELGCEYVIIGHSERRKLLNETDETVHRKVKMAIDAGLVPVVCVGETFEQRQEGSKDFVIMSQAMKAMEGLEFKSNSKVVIAYEPVWVIGTGQAVNPTEAQHAHQVIRQAMHDIFDPETVRNNFRVIYGGSVDENNVGSFTSLDNIDGVLVGIASLKAKDFIGIINKA